MIHPDSSATAVPENAGKTGSAGDSDATHDGPALTIVRPDKKTAAEEERWRLAAELGKMYGLRCTGAPGLGMCTEPSAVGVVVRGTLVHLPCRQHAGAVLRSLMSLGLPAVRMAALVDLIEAHGAAVQESAKYLRELFRSNGYETAIPPQSRRNAI